MSHNNSESAVWSQNMPVAYLIAAGKGTPGHPAIGRSNGIVLWVAFYSHGCLYRARRELTACTGGSWSFSREHQTTLSESPMSMSLDDGGLGSLEISAGGTGRWATCGCDADPSGSRVYRDDLEAGGVARAHSRRVMTGPRS